MVSQVGPNTKRALRPARDGDLCLLLEPSDADNQRLFAQQLALRAILGGRPITPVHLTTHRFEIEERQTPRLCEILRRTAAPIQPFVLIATEFVAIHSDFRNLNLLKWRVEVPAALQDCIQQLNAALDAAGANSLYPAGWVSTLLTAIEGIPIASLDHQLSRFEFPQPLLTARSLVLSRVLGPDSFEILDRFPLAG